MLFSRPVLDAIAAGEVSLAFRRWDRPRVRAGARQRTGVGVLAFDAVDEVRPDDVTEAEARAAGFPSRSALIAELARHGEGPVYRIRLRHAGADGRKVLRARVPESAEEFDAVVAALAEVDRRARRGPWTHRVLALIAERPGERAADLAAALGREKLPFKADIRRLKELGLTESLEIGYRLSPRGRAVLERLRG